MKIVQATECPYELDGHNDPDELRDLYARYEEAHDAFHDKIAEWNRLQRKRKRKGKKAQSAKAFLEFIGLVGKHTKRRDSGIYATPKTAPLRPPRVA